MFVSGILLCTTIHFAGKCGEQKSRADSYERAYGRAMTCKSGTREEQNKVGAIVPQTTKPTPDQIHLARLGHQALSLCHKGKVIGNAEILVEAARGCPLKQILPGLGLREVYKYLAQSALLKCTRDKSSKYAQIILDCVYKYDVPFDKISPSFNRETALRLLSDATSEEYKRLYRADRTDETVLPVKIDFSKLPQLPEVTQVSIVPVKQPKGAVKMTAEESSSKCEQDQKRSNTGTTEQKTLETRATNPEADAEENCDYHSSLGNRPVSTSWQPIPDWFTSTDSEKDLPFLQLFFKPQENKEPDDNSPDSQPGINERDRAGGCLKRAAPKILQVILVLFLFWHLIKT